MKIYIAGKITGLVYEDALRAFAEAELLLTSLGHEPVNPMKENGLDGDGNQHAWAEYMKRAIPHLLKCDGIYLLHNWAGSKGATLEYHIAKELGYKIMFAKMSVCDLCRLGEPFYSNKFLLGNDSVICNRCFTEWYEHGITDPAEIRARSIAARESANATEVAA